MKSIGIISILCSLSAVAKGQINTEARFASMAYVGVALQDVWSLQQNQAGICGIKKPIFSIGYAPSFLNKELRTQSAVGVFPYRRHVFGLSFQRYGIDEYHEQKMGITYAQRFNRLFVSVTGNYHQLGIQHYGSIKSVSLEVGLQYWLNQNLCLGAHVANPNQSMYGSNQVASVPVRSQLGAAYRFSNQLILAVGLEKILNQFGIVRTGLAYQLVEWLDLRGGVSINPFKQYMGFGIRYNTFRLDFATSSHPTLGYMPQLALSYEL